MSALQHVYPVPNHVRIVETGSGGSWCGSPRKRVVTRNETACGAPCTGHDVLPRGGKLSRVSATFLVCPECRRRFGLADNAGAIGAAADLVAGIQRENDERDFRADMARYEIEVSAVNAIWALESDGWRMILEDDPEYRAAFAYARAYSAERGE